jgi:enoyl-CoA hydratase/carnithine racemase
MTELYTPDLLQNWQEETFARVLVRKDANVLRLKLNRPEKRNAMDPLMVRELAFGLAVAKSDNEVRAVVLEAEGQVFCSGADLKAFAGLQEETNSTIPKPQGDLVIGDLFRHLHKPCLARVHGPVHAGGHLLIGGCTHILASDNAVFGLPEVKRGLWPMQVMASLCEILPPRYVLDWCMRGRIIDAEEANRVGLVTEVMPSEKLDEVLQFYLKDILANSPTAIRLGLKAWQELGNVPHEQRHAFLQKALMNNLATKDAREGIQAFKEKRDPVWTGE